MGRLVGVSVALLELSGRPVLDAEGRYLGLAKVSSSVIVFLTRLLLFV